MKHLIVSAVFLVGIFALASPASADVIIDCSQQAEGDYCINQGGEEGVCAEDDGRLKCDVDADDDPDAGADAGDGDTGVADSGSTDQTDETLDDDSACSVSSMSDSPVNTLAPIFIGFGLLAVARRRA